MKKAYLICKFKIKLLSFCILPPMILGCVAKISPENSASHSLEGCPTFVDSGAGSAPTKIQFDWDKNLNDGTLIGCGNAGVVYRFEHQGRLLVAKIFYSFFKTGSYPEEALFVDKLNELRLLSPDFAQHIVKTTKGIIFFDGKPYRSLIKTFIEGSSMLSAPPSLIDEFFRHYHNLHQKSLALRSGKFFVTDLHPENVLYDGQKLWIIDGSVAGIPPGNTRTFEGICSKQKWCHARLPTCTR